MQVPLASSSVPIGSVNDKLTDEIKEIKYVFRFMMRKSFSKAQMEEDKRYRAKMPTKELLGVVKDTTSEEEEESVSESFKNQSTKSKSTSSSSSSSNGIGTTPKGMRYKSRAKKKLHDVNVGPSGASEEEEVNNLHKEQGEQEQHDEVDASIEGEVLKESDWQRSLKTSSM